MKTRSQHARLLALLGCLTLAACVDETATSWQAPDAEDAMIDAQDAARDVAPDVEDTTPQPDIPQVEEACEVGPEGGFCVHGRCSLIVHPETVGERVALLIEERLAPSERLSDTLGASVCFFDPQGAALARDVTLGVAYDEATLPAAFSEAAIVVYALGDGAGRVLLDALRDEGADRVSVATDAALSVGLTLLPDAPRYAGDLGLGAASTDDPAGLLFNLSSYRFNAAFHDGQRLYLGNGPRLLIYNEGVPRDPTQPPDVVLGRVDLESTANRTSASNINGAINGIWSDGERLAISEGSRVLIWNAVPTESYTPADIVLGQSGFNTNEANRGGQVGADTLRGVDELASDGERLIVADALNHRVLVWDTFPAVNGQPADHVIGQEGMGSADLNAGAIPLYQSRGVALDGERLLVASLFSHACVRVLEALPTFDNAAADWTLGQCNKNGFTEAAFPGVSGLSRFGADGLAARDGAARVNVWRQAPEADAPVDLVIGKPARDVGGLDDYPSAAQLTTRHAEAGLYADERLMIVPDGHRVLIWETLPEVDAAPADLVIGQPSAVSNAQQIDYRGLDRETLAYAQGVSASEGLIAVADQANNRILLLIGDPLDGNSEVVVVGQRAGERFAPDEDWRSPSRATLDAPMDVFTDGERLVVADTGNHRVLVWSALPTSDGQPADLILGQPDAVSTRPNAGAGDADADGDADAGAATLHAPSSVWLEGDALYVSDTGNHRVLVWERLPEGDFAPADRVIGQPDLAANDPNRGGGWYAPAPDALLRPLGLRVVDDQLLVTDSENNRVLVFDASASSASSALRAVGVSALDAHLAPIYYAPGSSAHGRELSANQRVINADVLRRPSDVVVLGSELLVADTENHRVTAYPWPLPEGMPVSATRVIGQRDLTRADVDADGVSGASLERPGGLAARDGQLLVSDSHNHRLLRFDDQGAVADAAFGQTDLVSDSVNGSAPARGVLSDPAGASRAPDGTLWIADRDHHRVVALDGDTIALALGQRDTARAQPNAGQPAAAWTLRAPADAFTDGERLYVADAGNHRVLVWNALPTRDGQPADLILGQPDATRVDPNAGGGPLAPTASSMLAPQGVYTDGERLYVADSGNNRVLIWDTLPTSSGAPADRVLCQPDLTSNRANGGASAPAATTCASPTGLLVVDDALLVADSGNNRVLAFDAAPDGDGDPAWLVFGQPSFERRDLPAPDASPGAALMNQPTGLAHDGANLFVVDRGNNRVLIYDAFPEVSGQPADRVLGQPSFDTSVASPSPAILGAPNDIVVVPGAFNATRALITDAGKDRVALFEHIARLIK